HRTSHAVTDGVRAAGRIARVDAAGHARFIGFGAVRASCAGPRSQRARPSRNRAHRAGDGRGRAAFSRRCARPAGPHRRAQSDVTGSARMTHDLREELAQSIYTLLAEELFLALLRKPDVLKRTKQRAADQLITVWDDAALKIDDFAPLLESAWHARNRINSAYGTLLGATETFRLVTEDCSPEVLEFFGRDGMSADEAAAFEEFLFNMTSEELARSE